jgi:DNA polymerase
MPADDAVTRIARQHLETTRLLGVDFVPVAVEAPGVRAMPGASGEKIGLLDALRERYEREARVPKLIEGWNKIVFGDGSPDARVMFVGEAPGADEDAQGIPFVGRAGKLLSDMIKAMGLCRDSDCYISNILKVRPPNNRTPTVEEAELDGPFLLEQIRIIRPEALVTLGRPAAHFLLQRTDAMGALRGRWFEFDGIPLMPTYHPAFLLRQYTPENRKKVWADLRMVMDRLGLEAPAKG